MHNSYKKIKLYKSISVPYVSAKALISFDFLNSRYFFDFYKHLLIYYSLFQIPIYKNIYIISDADNFKNLSLAIL